MHVARGTRTASRVVSTVGTDAGSGSLHFFVRMVRTMAGAPERIEASDEVEPTALDATVVFW